ncbi:EF-hand domain-containing protein [Planctomycetota bacterium]|nr:EF-hand domain-containing protein [Planctomycetota bacterium]
MSTDNQPSALVKFGPILGPVAGLVIMLGLIAWAYSAGDVSGQRNLLNDKNSKVNSRLTTTDAETVISTRKPLRLKEDAERGYSRAAWAGPKNEGAAYDLPMDIKVRTTGADIDEFSQFDEDGGGSWSKEEWEQSPYRGMDGDKGVFENWDRDGDGYISKAEYETPPEDADELFKKLDVDPTDGELTLNEFPQLKEADKNQDNKVSPEEFADWNSGERVSFKKIGIVSDVTARIDPNAMKVVVSWNEPDIEDGFRPDDLQYVIYASSPEDRAKRDRDYMKVAAAASKLITEWKAGLKKWENEPSDEEGKSNKDKYGRKAEEEYKKLFPKPRKPKKPSEWNEVVRVSGSSAEVPFLLGATYRYAVASLTGATLLKDNYAAFIKQVNEDDGTFETAAVEQVSAPVRMENRVSMEYKSKSDGGGTIELGTWVANGSGDYHWITIVSEVTEDETDIGGEYTVSKMKGLNAKANNGDIELDMALEGLEGNQKINFVPYGNIPRGGEAGHAFKFVVANKWGFLVTSKAFGDYRLTKDARGPIVHATGEGDTQVRCLNIGKDKTVFEISRWVENEGSWYLAVYVTEVSEAKDVGGTVNLSTTSKGLTVYDNLGQTVRKGPNIELDLSAGTFDGFEGRSVKLGDSLLDVFGVLLK